MRAECPCDLVFEQYLLEPARELPPHVSSCESCQQRLTRMREQGAEFRLSVYPRTIDQILEKGVARGAVAGWRWALALSGLVPVAALGLTLVVRSGTPQRSLSPDGTQTKGASGSTARSARDLPFTVFVGTPDGARRVADGAAVPSDAQLRFRVDPPSRCWFSVVSVDGSGQVSQLYPETPSGIEVPRASLPGGAVLDGQAGPERLFALCSAKPLAVPEVQTAVREQFSATGAPVVRSMSRLAGVPDDVLQSTLLIEKMR